MATWVPDSLKPLSPHQATTTFVIYNAPLVCPVPPLNVSVPHSSFHFKNNLISDPSPVTNFCEEVLFNLHN